MYRKNKKFVFFYTFLFNEKINAIIWNMTNSIGSLTKTYLLIT